MTKHVTSLALFALAAMLGCGDGDGTGPDLSDLAGTYTASEFTFILIANPSTEYDLVTDGGASFDLVIEADGNYTMTGHFPGFPDEVDAGTIVLDGDQITLDGIDPISGTFTLNGSTLTIIIPSGAEFDFDDDGSDDPAGARLVFQRD